MSTNPSPAPERFCDLVMKGGITSGVVYPLAVCELAKAFRFRNVGGTSAGAIAAAATAAAELGRNSPNGGFRLLETLPMFLGSTPTGAVNSNLFHFFQPQEGTKPLFDICVAALGNGWGAIPRVLWAAAKAFPIWTLMGILPGLLFILIAWQRASALFFLVCLEVGLFFSIGLGLLVLAYEVYRRATQEIPTNFFGLCTGMSVENSEGPVQALTPWLTGYLNRLAGRSPGGPPVTFGDLWGTKNPLDERNINLEMMATSLSHGRPYRLPFRDDEIVRETRQFFFRSEEFRQFFPSQVVDWLEQNPRPPDERSREREAEFLATGFRPLPDPWNIPVIVAVRMSLSFPLLLSAVPLYAIDVTRVKESEKKLERCWFSDGGISSNFPVHFFDSPLPRWPTFAITLTDKHPDHPVGMYLPNTNSAGNAERWIRFESDPEKRVPPPGNKQLKGFVSAIFTAMQNWADNTQARLPGFRDRIARISLTENEGGLNLNMPKERIQALSERGRQVGHAFAERFANTHADRVLDWRNHRWVRLRSALAALEENLLKIDRSCRAPCNADLPYDDWVRTANNSELPSYPWETISDSADWKYQRQKATEMLDALRRCSQSLQAGHTDPMPLNQGAPRPRPELRVRPRI